MKITVREANKKDDKALINLTKACYMPGRISVRIDREPSYWSLITYRGGGKVFVAQKGNEIIGTISLHPHSFEYKSKVISALYIADFRVHPNYRNSNAAYRLMKYAQESSEYKNSDFTYVVIADGNTVIEKILKGKLGFPPFHKYTSFNLYEFKPKKRKTTIKEVLVGETEVMNSFKKNLNVMDICLPEDSKNDERILSISGKARISVCNTTFCKQNVIIKLPNSILIPLWIFKQAGRLLRIARKPWLNEPLEMDYMSSFDYQEGENGRAALKQLIDEERDYLIKNNLHFVSMAIDERASVNELLKSIPHYLFKSHLFACDGGRGSAEQLFNDVELINFNYAKV